MLPNEGPLTEAQREEVRAAVNAYCAKHGITKKDISRQVGGLNTSSVTQLLLNTYGAKDATLDEHLRAINDWMEVDARRRQTRPDDSFVETYVAKRLLGCAMKASQMRTMSMAHGPSGIGKSMVAHVIAEKFPGAIYLRISRGNTGFTALRSMLLTRLRLRRRRIARAQQGLTLDERVFDALRNSHRMIILDEAHRISDSSLEFLRDLFDECHIPILLLCTKDLLERIRRDNDEDHGQLYSRFGYVCDLTMGRDKMPGGKNPLFTINEIRRLFESDQVRLLPDGQAYLQDVANTLGQGSLRRCRDIVAWAIQIERLAKSLPDDARMTLGEAVLRKAEIEPRPDQAMQDDIRGRGVAVADARQAI